jgi:hypothetical protein
MTQQHGLYTIQTWLTLTAEDRSRLEQLVRDQGGDLADTVTRIVADRPLGDLPVVDGRPAGEPLPTRIYLTAAQRVAFDVYVTMNKVPLPDLLSRIVAEHVADVPLAVVEPAAPPRADARRAKAELARLRSQRDAAGATAPAWLHRYIADLEAEVARGV